MLWINILTPSYEWHKNSEFSHGESAKDVKDKLLAHEQSLGPHPEHRGMSEIENEYWEEGAELGHLCSIHTNQEGQQHAQNGNTQLKVEHGSIFYSYLPMNV